jgi:FG-GAP-like repeat/FG-GAP repeat
VDFDGDGTLDVISGSYDPGDVYLFRGLGKGSYAAGEPIRDEDGTPLVHHPVELLKYEAVPKAERSSESAITVRVASFGSWPCAVDYDGDGDLDVLIGSFSGGLWLRTNTGTRKEPRYDRKSVAVDADGKPLQMHGHAAPVAADWDGDGSWDLVVGSDTGEVQWFRNTGSKTKPGFAKGVSLLPAVAEQKFLSQYLLPDATPGRGARNQIAVLDYDGDGKLDLLVGDYSSVRRLRNAGEASVREQLAKIDQQLQPLADGDAKRKDLQQQKDAMFETEGTQSFLWLFRRR